KSVQAALCQSKRAAAATSSSRLSTSLPCQSVTSAYRQVRSWGLEGCVCLCVCVCVYVGEGAREREGESLQYKLEDTVKYVSHQLTQCSDSPQIPPRYPPDTPQIAQC